MDDDGDEEVESLAESEADPGTEAGKFENESGSK